jgi:hypothetical protein
MLYIIPWDFEAVVGWPESDFEAEANLTHVMLVG